MKKIIYILTTLLFLIVSCSKEPSTIKVTGVSVSPSSLSLTEGETSQLSVSVSPSDATDKSVTWSSSNPSVASVDANGKVTALMKGAATITATSNSGKKTGSCAVSVSAKMIPITGIELNKTELILSEGKEETLTVVISPIDATVQSIAWSSSNSDVAMVVSGKVTALKAGNTTITASVEGFKAECSVTVNMQYGKIAITDLRPVEILPVIGQVTIGDKQVYDHIEHLKLAEATRIRDMMWEYGAGSHSKEAYQQLMGRLNVGMMEEYPSGYDNFDIIGGENPPEIEGQHANKEWSILNSLMNHAHLKVVYSVVEWYSDKLEVFLQENPDAIVIMGCSRYSEERSKRIVSYWSEAKKAKELCSTGRLIIFKSGGNIRTVNGVFSNKTLHFDIEEDESSLYSLQSFANGKNDAFADRALLVTVGTNATGDCDQTGEIYESARFPVGFHDKVLFAGRAFPTYNFDKDTFSAEGKTNNGKYATSYTNYVNVAMMSLCFQMYAEVKDVFELLDMVRSTCLTDYIRLDGQTQPLQLINPAGLYKKHLTPQSFPSAISGGATINLEKGYYKGVLFSIPGAEVKVNGEWVSFDNKNKDLILSQNPMNLEWRLSGELLKKYGYTSGQTVEGQIITVDDKWSGLRLEVPITIKIQ